MRILGIAARRAALRGLRAFVILASAAAPGSR
jgi:hypothetical protein